MENKLSHGFSTIRELAKKEGNKGIIRQLLEIIILFCRSRLGPGYYFKARMFHSDVSWSHVLGYLSYKQYRNRVYQLNDRLYHRSSQNKIIEKAILSTYGQPTPVLLGYFHPQRGLDSNGSALRTVEQLERLLVSQQLGSKLSFKLSESWGGQGFRAIKCLAGGQVEDLKDHLVMEVDKFFCSLDQSTEHGIIIEDYLEQHPTYTAFNASSVNTVRVLVRKLDNGEVKSLCAFLRVGRAGSLVDNGDAGGIIFPVDIETGLLEEGFSTKVFGVYHDSHPDTKVQMKGFELPFFKEVVALSEQALLAFPGINFAGTDIAITPDGPAVLELNILPDYIDFAICRLPSRHVLMHKDFADE